MKKFLSKFLIGQMFKSKKFWYAVGSVLVPALVTFLGVDILVAEQIFQALLVLILGQGIADIKK